MWGKGVRLSQKHTHTIPKITWSVEVGLGVSEGLGAMRKERQPRHAQVFQGHHRKQKERRHYRHWKKALEIQRQIC